MMQRMPTGAGSEYHDITSRWARNKFLAKTKISPKGGLYRGDKVHIDLSMHKDGTADAVITSPTQPGKIKGTLPWKGRELKSRDLLDLYTWAEWEWKFSRGEVVRVEPPFPYTFVDGVEYRPPGAPPRVVPAPVPTVVTQPVVKLESKTTIDVVCDELMAYLEPAR